jgi:hypothetical protein
MFTSGKRIGIFTTILAGGLVGIAITLGGGTTAQNVDIWRKDQSNVVRQFPTTLQTVIATFTQGGGVRATSTDDTTATLLASDFDVENVIEFTPNVTGITLAITASTSLSSFVATAGQCRDIRIVNATTTAGAGVIIAGGTGSLLRTASTSVTVLPGGAADLKACRKVNTDIIWSILNTI